MLRKRFFTALTADSSDQNLIDEDQADLERLVSVKRQIGPGNVFHYPQRIPVSL